MVGSKIYIKIHNKKTIIKGIQVYGKKEIFQNTTHKVKLICGTLWLKRQSLQKNLTEALRPISGSLKQIK
jgi:hypothetical protein